MENWYSQLVHEGSTPKQSVDLAISQRMSSIELAQDASEANAAFVCSDNEFYKPV